VKHTINRRQFLVTTLAAGPALAALPQARGAGTERPFSFVLLGDLHLDKLEHHDFQWLEKDKAGDIRQIQNYSRITSEIMPRLFATVRGTVTELRASPAPPAFVLQVGDFVEGLCGNHELATRHHKDALAFVRDAKLGAPFLFTKGNHDVTGPGATEAYREVFHPFLGEQSAAFTGGGKLTTGNYTIEHHGAQFLCFDAYDRASLDWLEATLTKRTARHCFVVIHPPVVPYGARATWHLYSSAKDSARREKLLDLLGRANAFVLGGHIHKFNTLVRATPRGGRFLQLAVSSIINAPEVKPKDVLNGLQDYTGDQVKVEPNHSPGTEKERRAVYDAERPFVRQFDYADLPGYAVVTVNGAEVSAKIFSGVGRELWRTVAMTKLLEA
jgi:3',5'-cyclic AMP phosphodiesterase CpdA